MATVDAASREFGAMIATSPARPSGPAAWFSAYLGELAHDAGWGRTRKLEESELRAEAPTADEPLAGNPSRLLIPGRDENAERGGETGPRHHRSWSRSRQRATPHGPGPGPAGRRRARIVVVGGGVAGLETLMALRALAGERLEVTLVSPRKVFSYRPLAAAPPLGIGRAHPLPLDRVAHEAHATLLTDTVEAVDAEHGFVRTASSDAIPYDALVLACGAKAVPAVANAVTWDERSRPYFLGGLMADIEQGHVPRLAIVIPPGPTRAVRGYELGVVVAREARSMSAAVETTIIAPSRSPRLDLGPRGAEVVSGELRSAGVNLLSPAGAEVEPGHPPAVVVHSRGPAPEDAATVELPRLDTLPIAAVEPDADGFIEADRILALPELRGCAIAGVAADTKGFVDVDEHGRVPGLDQVWAVGDATGSAVKSGAASVAQAGAVAADIAASYGAWVEQPALDPESIEELSGLPRGSFLRSWLAGETEQVTTPAPALV
jgi:sulfide:quinone oxidoreductase